MLGKQIDNSNNNNNNPEHVKVKIKALKDECEQIIEHRTREAIIRSKPRWYNEGEKNTKYFLTLEKRHFKQGTINQLKKMVMTLLPQTNKFWPNANVSMNSFTRQEKTSTTHPLLSFHQITRRN